MAKRSWSYSALKDFKGCARRYNAVRIKNMYPPSETEATIYGKMVHKAFEDYVRDGRPLPSGLNQFVPLLQSVLKLPGEKICEFEMALNHDKNPTGFKASDVWVRGIADVLVIDGKNARCLDWKTGSAKYPDKDQLELMALMTFAHFPDVQEVKGALVFVHHKTLVKGAYLRKDKDKLWGKWLSNVALLEAAFETDKWHPNPTPLCRYCPCEFCEFYVR